MAGQAAVVARMSYAPEIVFLDAKSALRWAEEVAGMPDVRSQLSQFQKQRHGTLNGHEAREIAQTISVYVESLKPYYGPAMKSIWVGGDAHRDVFLAESIGELLVERECGRHKGRDRMDRLAATVIKSERALQLYGDRYWYKRMAHDIGISVRTFREELSWVQAMGDARTTVLQWLNVGERLLGAQLEYWGWL